MTLKEFCSKHHLRIKRDECGDLNVLGRRGDIHEYGQGLFAATVLNAPSAAYWNRSRAAFARAGYRITQNGDTEGIGLFDPDDAEQVRVALRATRVYRKRVLSAEVRLKAAETLAGVRNLDRKTHFGQPKASPIGMDM